MYIFNIIPTMNKWFSGGSSMPRDPAALQESELQHAFADRRPSQEARAPPAVLDEADILLRDGSDSA